MSEFLDAALSYAAHGWRVFPLRPCSKEPATAHGFKDATTDEAQIRAWWSKEPNDNVAIATGNGNCVLDVDDKPNALVQGSDSLREWELEHGDLTPTVTAITGSGGTHYFYDVGAAYIPCSASAKIAIDIRCDGGYVVAPPSIHPNGNRYVWDVSPDDMDVCKVGDVEKACIQWIHDSASGSNGKRDTSIPSNPIREGEGRNNWLYAQGASARGKGADDDTVRIFLEALNVKKCAPPLPAHELNRTIESVCKLPVGMSDEAKAAVANKETKPKKANHVKIAEAVMDKHQACFLDGAPAVFDGMNYEIGWSAIERAVIKEAPNAKDRERKEVVKYLDLVMPHEKPAPARYIGFLNGVLDIETMDFLSLTPELCIPNTIPHNWVPDAQNDLLDVTLQKIACNDPFVEANLCEFIGLSMFRSGKYAFAALLLGRQGKNASNGKSTYIDLVRNVLGKNNYSSLSLQDLGGNFQQEFLAGKLANLGDDISSEFAKGKPIEVLKKAVAGSEIHTDVKNGKGYDFTPYVTMIFSANRFPDMKDMDDGLLRRLFPIRFNAHFSSADADYDPDIGEKLKSEEVIEAAIVRGISGLRRIMRQRRPTDTDESRAILKGLQIDSSNILQWLEDAGIKRDAILNCTTAHVYGEYDRWCSDSGVRHKYAKWKFSNELCDYLSLRVLNTTRNNKSVRLFVDASIAAKNATTTETTTTGARD